MNEGSGARLSVDFKKEGCGLEESGAFERRERKNSLEVSMQRGHVPYSEPCSTLGNGGQGVDMVGQASPATV